MSVTNSPDTNAPTTIVLIHGLWMTALSWEHWVERYTNRGYRVIARSWPGMEGDIDEFRRDPSAVPGPDHVLFQASLANFNPHAATTVNFHNDERAPLLLIAGGKDHIAPASVTKANYNLYRKSKAITAYKEYPDRSHFTLGQPGWEEVADYALTWAVDNASKFQKAQPVTAGAH